MDIGQLLSLGSFSKPLVRKPTSVAVDTRLLQPGAIFFALPGEKVDGHAFLEEAWAKGAVGAVINQDFTGSIPLSMPVMRVKNQLATLQKFGQLTVAANGAKVFALTGSIGKTTTKDFANTIVSIRHKVEATQSSHNSQIGLALTLINGLKGGEEWIIAEMGMTHAGDLKTLTAIAPPDIALVTHVCLVHSENFSSLEDIAKTKAEIFAGAKTCIYNADTAHAEVLAKIAGTRGKTFSMHDKNAFWSMCVQKDALIVREEEREVILPKPEFPAPHVYGNLLAAIAASRSMGVSWDDVCDAIPQLRLSERRLEQKSCRGILFINDSISACEPSMMAALDVLKETPGARKIAVLGAMKELGVFTEQCHKNVWNKACEVADSIYSLGQEWNCLIDVKKNKKNKYVLTSSLDELIAVLEKDLKEGDTVLLKGSRWANQLWKVVDHFSG